MFCAAAFAGRALTVDPRRTRRYLYYYENAHFKTTSESQGHIDITSITSVEGLPPATKKEKSKQITIVTKVSCVFGRVAPELTAMLLSLVARSSFANPRTMRARRTSCCNA